MYFSEISINIRRDTLETTGEVKTMVVKKRLMVRINDTQTEFFDDCIVSIESSTRILNITDSKKNDIASFYDWKYWRYMDEK